MLLSAKCRNWLPQINRLHQQLLNTAAIFILFFTGTGASTLYKPGVGAHFSTNKPIIFFASMSTMMQLKGNSPSQTMHFNGAGFASHLGNTFIEVNTTLVPATMPGQVRGNATFTAATGEEFYTSFTGTTVNEEGKTIVHFVHCITGGTGRFNDINGLLRGNCTHDSNSKKGTIALEGEIDF
jgi:hypothetical protein